ncbi:MAG: CDP-glucose 4,6-dehydratase [Desulfuromusa sp.]|nr:CDP-glucose 4,6-dehydratase [Desulfuromusa sp.]
MLKNTFNGKKVLITGNTGFKGSWLTVWLLKLGAEVVGISKDIPTTPAMFEELNLEARVRQHYFDVHDLTKLKSVFEEERPDYIFHLAAQPLVSISYSDPVQTFSSNVMGTVNVLECLRLLNPACVAVFITSDKCYDNVEWVWGYKESDSLGGKDIYSGSKGGAEMAIKSYFNSFFTASDCNFRIGIGRAGNVIGGGDWAADRIVADCMRAWSEDDKVELRCPSATRPWQHVLEPLSGYLVLAQVLGENAELNGEAFNFGPRVEQNHSVKQLMDDLSEYWRFESSQSAYEISDNIPFHEAGLLKLNCDKALFHLKWQASLNYIETIRFVGEWYYKFYNESEDMLSFTQKQLDDYEETMKRWKIQ